MATVKQLSGNRCHRASQNIHNNFGHPSKEEFLRALRPSRARPEVLDYVRREFECPACAAKGHPPKPGLPAALPRTFRFNETLGVYFFETLSPRMVPMSLSATWCVGALWYQLCIPILDKIAGTVAKCVAERWIQYFGPPMSIISDQGKEFVGTQFKEFTNANSILLHIIDVRAPRQNGRTERHGDIHKRIVERARWMHSPSSPVALQHLAMECNVGKNRLSNLSGNSPLQRVFGTGHRLPADLTSDDVHAPDPVYGLAATDASFEESRQIREAARKAHAEVSVRDRIEDCVRARPRTQTVLRADDVIMVWKTNPPSKRGRWVGPGVCIGTHRGSVWVNMRGSLWKCRQLQCKLATTETWCDDCDTCPDDWKRLTEQAHSRLEVPLGNCDDSRNQAQEETEEVMSQVAMWVPMLRSCLLPLELVGTPLVDDQPRWRDSFALHICVDSTPRELLKLSFLVIEHVRSSPVLAPVQPMSHQERNVRLQSSEDFIPERQSSNRARERTVESADEHPAQRPRLENPASSISWSKFDEPGHWVNGCLRRGRHVD